MSRRVTSVANRSPPRPFTSVALCPPFLLLVDPRSRLPERSHTRLVMDPRGRLRAIPKPPGRGSSRPSPSDPTPPGRGSSRPSPSDPTPPGRGSSWLSPSDPTPAWSWILAALTAVTSERIMVDPRSGLLRSIPPLPPNVTDRAHTAAHGLGACAP